MEAIQSHSKGALPEAEAKNWTNELKICTLNIRSLKTKVIALTAIVTENSPDILVITETHLTQEAPKLPGYQSFQTI